MFNIILKLLVIKRNDNFWFRSIYNVSKTVYKSDFYWHSVEYSHLAAFSNYEHA